MNWKTHELEQYAYLLRDHGWDIYYCPSHYAGEITYFFFVKDNKIGYVQADYFGGLRFSTVHKPDSEVGTGFTLDPARPTAATADLVASMVAPDWATPSQLSRVRKYSNWGEKAGSYEFVNYQKLEKANV